MPAATPHAWRLTGRAAVVAEAEGFSRGRSRLVVRVEETAEGRGGILNRWRDGSEADLASPALSWLVNGKGGGE